MPVGKLDVQVVNATGLRMVQLAGHMNPYVKLRVDQQNHRSEPHHRGHHNPVWNETFVFDVFQGHAHLYVQGNHDIIGELSIALDQVFATGRHDGVLSLIEPGTSNVAAGTIHLILTFRPGQMQGQGMASQVPQQMAYAPAPQMPSAPTQQTQAQYQQPPQAQYQQQPQAQYQQQSQAQYQQPRPQYQQPPQPQYQQQPQYAPQPVQYAPQPMQYAPPMQGSNYGYAPQPIMPYQMPMQQPMYAPPPMMPYGMPMGGGVQIIGGHHHHGLFGNRATEEIIIGPNGAMTEIIEQPRGLFGLGGTEEIIIQNNGRGGVTEIIEERFW